MTQPQDNRPVNTTSPPKYLRKICKVWSNAVFVTFLNILFRDPLNYNPTWKGSPQISMK